MLHDGLKVRVLKAFPELMILLKGMLAVRTLACMVSVHPDGNRAI